MNKEQIQGMTARSEGKSKATNPHPKGSDAFKQWEKGYGTMGDTVAYTLNAAHQMYECITQMRNNE